jgi:hypothetical protein
VFDLWQDPVSFASGALLLMGVALLACWLPTRRAMAEPAIALRVDYVPYTGRWSVRPPAKSASCFRRISRPRCSRDFNV